MIITPEVIATHNLTPEEFQRIKELLGREPSFDELGIFSVMWSEHCSYKSSRVHLKRLPTTGTRVIVPPGENAAGRWRQVCSDFSDPSAPRMLKVELHTHTSDDPVDRIPYTTCELIDRAAVQTEVRNAKDIYERIAGGAGPGAVKAVAPVGMEQISITIPAGIDQVSLLGEVLDAITPAGREAAAPGRPVAIISSVMVEYRPKAAARGK
jgi:hypothetical protein